MKALAYWLAIALIIVLLVPSVFLLSILAPYPIGWAILGVPVAAVCTLAIPLALLRRWSAGRGALVAAGLSLAIFLAVAVAVQPWVHRSRPSCDAFCVSETGAHVLAIVLGLSFGALVGGGSALVTWVILTAAGRSAGPGDS